MNTDLGALLAVLAASGNAMQEAFEPPRFLAEFSAHVQRLLPHDRVMIAYREEGGRLSIYAEHAIRGALAHEGRYTIAFDPAGWYTPAALILESVLAGGAMFVTDMQTDPRFAQVGPDLPKARQIGLRSRLAVPLASRGQIIGAFLASSVSPNTYAEPHLAAARQLWTVSGNLPPERSGTAPPVARTRLREGLHSRPPMELPARVLAG
jgi:GAF domain-containing protein